MSRNRQGKHKEGNTLLGAYISPEFRALVILTCDATGKSITELLMDGIRRYALEFGIIDGNDNIKPERRAAYELVLDTVKKAIAGKSKTKRSAK